MPYLRPFAALLLQLFCFLPLQQTFARSKFSSPQPRRSFVSLSQNWKFIKDPLNQSSFPKSMSAWEDVNLPHTWNDQDVMDDIPGYYRGAAGIKRL